MVVGSAVNCVTAGAGGFAGAAGAAGAAAGGGGGATGAFFLQPATNTARPNPTPAITIFCLLLNMKIASSFHKIFRQRRRAWAASNYLPHTGL
jgi:hypothetical protein